MAPFPIFGDAISLHEAARSPHFLKPVHSSSIHRWCTYGLRGIRLQTWLLAGRRVTSDRAIQEFLMATSLIELSRKHKRLQKAFEAEENSPPNKCNRD